MCSSVDRGRRRAWLTITLLLAGLGLGCTGSDDGDRGADATGERTTAEPAVAPPPAAAASAVTVTDPWVAATPEGMTTGALSMTIISGRADRLVGVEVAPTIARTVELHETRRETSGAPGTTLAADGEVGVGVGASEARVTMERIDAIELPAQTPVDLHPGARHVMLVDLVGPLVEGETVELTLVLANAGEHRVIAAIRSV
jgi:periplasmic copper chaperone A